MTKTVGIFTEGGVGIGLGHLTRCRALAYTLQQRGCNPVFFIFSDHDVAGVVQPFSVQNIGWKADVGSIIKKDQLSFAIVDSYLASRDVYDVISSILDGKMLIIDDCMRLTYPKSFVVNPSIYGESLGYPIGDGLRYLLGKDYIILRPDFWEVGPKKIKDTIENIFLTLGGSADKKILEQIALFIQGHSDAHVRILDSYQKKYSAVQMREMMSVSDLCISGGGQTMYELARLGVPTISVTLDDNHMLNVKALQKAGFSFSAGKIDEDLFFARLRDGLDYMSDPIVRKKCSDAGQKAVDGKGVRRLADIIIGAI